MELKTCLLTKNDCYKKAQKIKPDRIVVHSTGANNTTLKRYVQPDDGLLGKNLYNNHWNKPKVAKCVHALIGRDKNKEVQVYQTLPFDYAAWGVGKGSKGSYNYINGKGAIQFEICEDNLKDKAYFERVFNLAIEFCAYLCTKYNISVKNIVSHAEAAKKGYASNHGDCDHWLKKHGKDMNWFRSEVEKKLKASTDKATEETPKVVGKAVNYLAKITSKELNVREEPNDESKITCVVKKGEAFTITRESNGWGKLKSGAGWIALSCTKKQTNKPTKTVNAVAKEVIAGKWGSGTERKKKLKAAGYDYKAVQAEVNKILSKK
jgi:N-acetylmuramoyl-L-alanine amidase